MLTRLSLCTCAYVCSLVKSSLVTSNGLYLDERGPNRARAHTQAHSRIPAWLSREERSSAQVKRNFLYLVCVELNIVVTRGDVNARQKRNRFRGFRNAEYARRKWDRALKRAGERYYARYHLEELTA